MHNIADIMARNNTVLHDCIMTTIVIDVINVLKNNVTKTKNHNLYLTIFLRFFGF